VRGAFAPVADHRLGIWDLTRSGASDSHMVRLGPGGKGMGTTSQRRDAQGLTLSAVISDQAMQPGVSTRGKQNWRLALCVYGMTFALRHRVHLAVGQPLQSLAPPLCAPARVIPGRTLLEGEGRGWFKTVIFQRETLKSDVISE
jgi:hypothetical protein